MKSRAQVAVMLVLLVVFMLAGFARTSAAQAATLSLGINENGQTIMVNVTYTLTSTSYTVTKVTSYHKNNWISLATTRACVAMDGDYHWYDPWMDWTQYGTWLLPGQSKSHTWYPNKTFSRADDDRLLVNVYGWPSGLLNYRSQYFATLP